MDSEFPPEFAVTREVLSARFAPPIAKSTFFDLVNRGRILPVSGLRGYYRLNASLQKLGMPPVSTLPDSANVGDEPRSVQLVIFALSLVLGKEFPRIARLDLDSITMNELAHIKRLVAAHMAEIKKLADPIERAHYAEGVLEAQRMIDREG